MQIKLLKDGMGLPAGAVIDVPEIIAGSAIERGIAEAAPEPSHAPPPPQSDADRVE